MIDEGLVIELLDLLDVLFFVGDSVQLILLMQELVGILVQVLGWVKNEVVILGYVWVYLEMLIYFLVWVLFDVCVYIVCNLFEGVQMDGKCIQCVMVYVDWCNWFVNLMDLQNNCIEVILFR